jgi:hypothetical protein
MIIRHKFHAKRTECNGIKFSSKKEAAYYQKLMMMKQSAQIVFFLRQAPLHLPGGVRYVVDFVEFWADGSVRFVDVKGFKTPEYKAKKKMVEALYPIEIIEA